MTRRVVVRKTQSSSMSIKNVQPGLTNTSKRPPQTYLVVFHGYWDNGKLVDVGDDPCFQEPPTWGICRPNTRKYVRSGDTLVFICCINKGAAYFLKGWFVVGEKISYPEALQKFPQRSNVILVNNGYPTSNSNIVPVNVPTHLKELHAVQGHYKQNPNDNHTVYEWKCRRMLQCNKNKIKLCNINSACDKSGVNLDDYKHYVVALPDKWVELEDLRISGQQIVSKFVWEKGFATPKKQHNVCNITEWHEDLFDLIKYKKEFKDKADLMTSQIIFEYLKNNVASDLQKILSTALSHVYLDYLIPVVPQTAKQMLGHSKNAASVVKWNRITGVPDKIFLNISAGANTPRAPARGCAGCVRTA